MSEEVVEYEPSEPFPGVVGETVRDSSPAWPVPKRASSDAPNVLFYVLDDIGYGHIEPFGGLIEVPAIQRMADRGLRYSNMHTTALCSPSRSCVLTGRNHHSNSLGSIDDDGDAGYLDAGEVEEVFLLAERPQSKCRLVDVFVPRIDDSLLGK